jgi:septal ring factor EnvC (AmiA/AmiB activator)
MSDLASRIRAVHLHVARLLAEREASRVRLSTMEHELREQQRNTAVLQARIAELERENEVLRVTRPAPHQRAEGQLEAKQRIDDLVNEIDRCMALLTH